MRRDLKAQVKAGRLRVLTSWWAIQEISAIAPKDWPLCRRISRYLVELAWPAVLRPTSDLEDSEIQHSRRLRGAERFMTKPQVTNLARSLGQRELMTEVGSESHAEARKSVSANRAVRDAAWESLRRVGAEDPVEAARLWSHNSAAWVDSWSRDLLRHRLSELGRPEALAEKYPLERVPTIVNFIAVMLARIAWYNAHERAIKRGDDADIHHYVAACYADVLVSRDGPFTEIIGLIPRRGSGP